MFAFYRDAWADTQDYVDGLRRAGREVAAEAIAPNLDAWTNEPFDDDPNVILFNMPDSDFLLLVEERIPSQVLGTGRAKALQTVCDRRGLPYRMAINEQGKHVFEWVGDPVVEHEVIAPTLSALDDPRLSRGPQHEFAEARRALREGSAQHAVAMACNAVESGLTVLLAERGAGDTPKKPTLIALLKRCQSAGLFPIKPGSPKVVPIEHVLAAAGRFGNDRGRHGGGEEPHSVTDQEAEAVVASAAIALTFISRSLP